MILSLFPESPFSVSTFSEIKHSLLFLPLLTLPVSVKNGNLDKILEFEYLISLICVMGTKLVITKFQKFA